jgi:hypothetical protein
VSGGIVGEQMNAAIIVAHPDDEVIWCGGLMLQRPQWHWTVLSLCRADDPDRRPKFEAVCSRLGATGLISNLDDSEILAAIDPAKDIGPRVLDFLGHRRWNVILTHGDNGEYGHLRHRQVHMEVCRLLAAGALESQILWTFAYDCELDGKCRPSSRASMFIPLSSVQLETKKSVIRDCYGYGEDSFEVSACVSPECFACTIC